MTAALRKLWTILLPAVETLAGMPLVLMLHWTGVTGRNPLWLELAVLVPMGIIQHRSVQFRLSGGDLSRRLWLRLGLHMGIQMVQLYTFGWGSVFTVGIALAAIMHIRWSGPRVLWPLAFWAVVGTAVAQTGIQLGLIFTFLSPVSSHVIAITGCLLAVLFARQYAMAVAEREAAQLETEWQARRFTALVQHSSDIIMVADREGLVSYVSPAVEQALGYRPDEVIGSTPPYLPADERERLATLVAPLWDKPGGQVRLELQLRHRDGSHRWYDTMLINRFDDQAVQGLIANLRDVTDQRAAAERLTYDATHDPVTGLPNRRVFLPRLDQLLEEIADSDTGLALLYIDLDEFKQINDRRGHEVGDLVLAHVADVLRASVLGGDLICRLGGDEYAAVLCNVSTADQGAAVARRFLTALCEPLDVAGQALRVGASVGIAIAAPHETTAELLHRADVAMYAAKRRRGGWVVHTHELELPVTTVTRNGP